MAFQVISNVKGTSAVSHASEPEVTIYASSQKDGNKIFALFNAAAVNLVGPLMKAVQLFWDEETSTIGFWFFRESAQGMFSFQSQVDEKDKVGPRKVALVGFLRQVNELDRVRKFLVEVRNPIHLRIRRPNHDEDGSKDKDFYLVCLGPLLVEKHT
jgi:hypothetical protein